MPWRYLVGLGCDGAGPWDAICHLVWRRERHGTASQHSNRPPTAKGPPSLVADGAPRQGSPPTRHPKASLGEGGLTVDATIDGGP
eukprot:5214005-Prymnesium_polylepis.1